MYNPGFSIFKLYSGIKNKKRFNKKKKRKTFVLSTTNDDKKRRCNQREKTNRMTMSEASVDDVILLTYDVTACMYVCVCVYVHASVFHLCARVRNSLSVFFFFLVGMLNLISFYFFFISILPNSGQVFAALLLLLPKRRQFKRPESRYTFISTCNDIFKGLSSFSLTKI